MENDFYIPADGSMSLNAVRALSEEQLRSRQLRDPHYAGFNPNFDWTQYVTVDINDPVLKQQAIDMMNRRKHDPAFQQVLRQGFDLRAAMQKDPLFPTMLKQFSLTDSSLLEQAKAPRFSLREIPTSGIVAQAGGSSAIPLLGIMFIDPIQIRVREFLGKDGKYHHASFDSVTGHEYDHFIDPLKVLPQYLPLAMERIVTLTQQMAKARIDAGIGPVQTSKELLAKIRALPQQAQITMLTRMFAIAEWQSAIYELPAIADANVHSRVPGEAERALVHNDSRNDPAIVPDASLPPPGMTPTMLEFLAGKSPLLR